MVNGLQRAREGIEVEAEEVDMATLSASAIEGAAAAGDGQASTAADDEPPPPSGAADEGAAEDPAAE